MDSGERTAREARHLQANIRDLRNVLRLALGEVASGSAENSSAVSQSDPYARIAASSDDDTQARPWILRLRRIGVAVVGLDGVGCLIAETFAHYGVQRLVVADTAAVELSDLDTIPFVPEDVGQPREQRVAARLRRLNPDVAVHALGVPLVSTRAVTRALRSVSREGSIGDNESDGSSSEEEEEVDKDGAAPPLLHLVVLCSRAGELALQLNELCCALTVPLAIALTSADGLSGESVLVSPGRSSCLQCLDKRMMWAAARADAARADASIRALPSTACILAGLCVQNAVMLLLASGTASSRLEYDGLLESLERSELVPPVRHCASDRCRRLQRHVAGSASL